MFRIPSKDLVFGAALGRGAFGVVYEGTYRDRAVALKELHVAGDDAFLELEREALMQKNLPNLGYFPEVYGMCFERQYPVVVMERLQCNLSTFLQDAAAAQLPVSEKVSLMLYLAKAIEFLHDHRIVHRDIKSLNVLITTDGKPKVADFGLAVVRATTSSPVAGVAGTVLWAAPEVLSGEGCTYCSDVYSLAVVFWEIISGVLPWQDAAEPIQILRRVANGERPPMPVGTLPELTLLISSMWCQDHARRPSMKEVVHCLNQMAVALRVQTAGSPRLELSGSIPAMASLSLDPVPCNLATLSGSTVPMIDSMIKTALFGDYDACTSGMVPDCPIVLIEKNDTDFCLSPAARALLRSPALANRKLKIIGIVGKYRTGKSFVMNRLLGQEKGFELGHETNGKTRGIWAWFSLQPDSDEAVVGLDSEGLFDTANADKVDMKIFLLMMMVTSLFIINTERSVDAQTFRSLQFVCDMKTLLDVGAASVFAPDLLWLVRDALKLTKDMKSWDDYLEQKIEEVASKADGKEGGDVAKTLKSVFKRRRCVGLPCPVKDQDDLEKIEKSADLLSEKFLNAAKECVASVLLDLRRFSIEPPAADGAEESCAIELNGQSFADFVDCIVQSVNSDSRIEVPDLFQEVKCREFRRAVEAARKAFLSEIDSTKLPLTDSLLDAMFENGQRSGCAQIQKLAPLSIQEDATKAFNIMTGLSGDSPDGLERAYRYKFPEVDLRECFEQENAALSRTEKDKVLQAFDRSVQTLVMTRSCASMDAFRKEIESAQIATQASFVGPSATVAELLQGMNAIVQRAIAEYGVVLRLSEEEKKRALLEEQIKQQRELEEQREAARKADEVQFQKKVAELQRQQDEQKSAFEKAMAEERARLQELERRLQQEQNNASLRRQIDASHGFLGYAAPRVCSQPDIFSDQCIGKTKKGTRCRRTAQKGSAYCWQHP